jgi:hypothetical protein
MHKQDLEIYTSAVECAETEGLIKSLLSTVGLLVPTLELAYAAAGLKRDEHLLSALRLSAKARTTLQAVLWQWEGRRKLAEGETIVVRASNRIRGSKATEAIKGMETIKAEGADNASMVGQATETAKVSNDYTSRRQQLTPTQHPEASDTPQEGQDRVPDRPAYQCAVTPATTAISARPPRKRIQRNRRLCT